MKNPLSLIGLAAIALATPQAAQAQSSPSPAPVVSPGPATSPVPSPSPSPSLAPSPPPHLFQPSGFADVGYSSHIGNATTKFGSSNPLNPVNPFPSRVFDYNDRLPDLQNLNLDLALNAGNLTGKVELSAGTDADTIQSWPGAFNGFDVTQAYVAYQLGKVSVQAGKFETLAGAEVIESPSDLEFSRSILFGFAVPFTHTGARLTYAVTPHLNVIGGVNFGWDEIRSTNGRLTAEYGLAFNPSAAVSLTAQGYTGIEQIANYTSGYDPYPPFLKPNSPVATTPLVEGSGLTTVNTTPPGAQGQRSLIDIVATVHPTAATTATLNYDHGLQHGYTIANANGNIVFDGTASWSGLAGYLSYQLSPKVVASLRYEGFTDPQGYRTGITTLFTDPATLSPHGPFWHEGTFTVGYTLTSAVTIRAEYRHDTISGPYFLNGDGTGSNGNSTVSLDGYVKF